MLNYGYGVLLMKYFRNIIEIVSKTRNIRKGNIMKKAFIIMVFIFLMVILFAQSAITEVKPTIAVLDFESVGSEEHLGKAVSEIMRTELIGTRKFRVVERSQINKALSEQQMQKSGIVDEKSAVQIGKLLGADLIIIGSVVKIGTAYTINSRMIDVKTGEATLGKNVTGNDLNLLTNLSRSLIDSLFGTGRKQAEQMPIERRAMKDGMEYSVDRLGFDYRSFELSDEDPKICQSSCSVDPQCKAWTYVKPGIQGNLARCWLKDKVPQPRANDCCISGTPVRTD
jgi:TolB-like protein